MAPALDGVWGKPTSTLDWCEQNYEVTAYIAEFWNTVSNLAMIVPPAYGALQAWRKNLETRLVLCYGFLLVVGIGSWCFHMTLWFEMQLLDELPMVWGTLILVYTLAEVSKPVGTNNYYLMAGLILYGTVITAVSLFHIFKNAPTSQQHNGISVLFSCFRRKHFELWLFVAATLSYLTGFLVWNVDNAFCAELSSARSSLPPLVVPFTQFHALWHCFAGYGAYISILYCCQARLSHLKQECRMKLGPVGLEIEVGKGMRPSKPKSK
ncbi:unnamed protein product [Ixodes hexagonus]